MGDVKGSVSDPIERATVPLFIRELGVIGRVRLTGQVDYGHVDVKLVEDIIG